MNPYSVFEFAWEVRLMELLQTAATPILTAIASFITRFGEELFLVGVLGFLYWGCNKEYGKFVFTNFAPAQLCSPLIKNIVRRGRPYMTHDSIKCLTPVDSSYDIYDVNAQGFSFPSMHSGASAVIYGSLPVYTAMNGVKNTKKQHILTVLGILIPLLVGLSRIYLGVHYPTDVLAGWGIGILSILIMSFLQRRIRNHHLLYLLVCLITLPGVFIATSNDFYTSYGIILGGFLGFIYEEKFVNFANTDKLWKQLIRTLLGAVLFLSMNALLKLPFSGEFLDSGVKAALLVRLFRYTICSFTVIGLYPYLFKKGL